MINSVLALGQIGEDEYKIQYTKEIGNLLDEMDRRENFTIRPEIETSAIEVLSKNTLLSKGYQIKSSAAKQNDFFIKVEDTVYPIGENAYCSINQRIELNGNGLKTLKKKHPEKFVLLMNTLLHDIEKIRLIIIDDKVRAIFSAANGGYKVIPAKDVLLNMLDKLEAKYSNIDFKNAEITYDNLYIKLLFPNEKKEIQDLYEQPVTYFPGLMLKTSDTGYSSIEIYPIWDILGRGGVILGDSEETIKVHHRGKNASLENLTDDVPNIFSLLHDTIRLGLVQKAYTIKYPELTIEHVCKHLKLGEKVTNQMKERLNLFYYINGDGNPIPISGFDITKLFLEMATQENDETKKRKFEIVAGKAFNINYSKYDKLDD